VRGTFLGFVVALLAATPATAAIDYSGGQNRSVATVTGVGGGGGAGTGDTKETLATGFWSETAASSYSSPCPCPPSGGGGSASASASQVSDLGDVEISMEGTLSASGTVGYIGHAETYLGVMFSLVSDSPYVSSLSTIGPEVQFFNLQRIGTTPIDANSSGTLVAGTYSLVVHIKANSFVGTNGLYAYNLLIVPEPSSVCLIFIAALLAAASPRRAATRTN